MTNPRKRLNIQIEANGSEATYAGACMTIIASYGGNLIQIFVPIEYPNIRILPSKESNRN